IRQTSANHPASLRVLLLGQCTTSWLINALVAAAWENGLLLDVTEGDYDNIVQTLMTRQNEGPRPDVVIFIPWTQRLFSEASALSAEERVQDELAFWQQTWKVAIESLGVRILQVGYDWVVPGPLGHHLGASAAGPVGMVRQLNDKL